MNRKDMNNISRAAQLLINQGVLPDDFEIIQISGCGVLGYSGSHDMSVMWTPSGYAYKSENHYEVDDSASVVYWNEEEDRPVVMSPLLFWRARTLDIKL